MRLVRIALQGVLFFVLLGVVIAIGSPETGLTEKLLLAIFAGGLIWFAARVRRTGPPQGPHSA
jgi:hypothetical protein